MPAPPTPRVSVDVIIELVDRPGRPIVLIERRHPPPGWALPGGFVDIGETVEAAARREAREETGLTVEVGASLDEHLFEVLPGRFVRILPFACRLVGGGDVVLSHEHLETHWLPLAELGERIAGHALPAGYLGAIRQAIDQPLSPSARVV